jgi:hypothetical protein
LMEEFGMCCVFVCVVLCLCIMFCIVFVFLCIVFVFVFACVFCFAFLFVCYLVVFSLFSCDRILMLLTCLSYNFMRTLLQITMLIKFLPICQFLPNYYELLTMRYLRMSAIICFVFLFVLYCFCSFLVVMVSLCCYRLINVAECHGGIAVADERQSLCASSCFLKMTNSTPIHQLLFLQNALVCLQLCSSCFAYCIVVAILVVFCGLCFGFFVLCVFVCFVFCFRVVF